MSLACICKDMYDILHLLVYLINNEFVLYSVGFIFSGSATIPNTRSPRAFLQKFKEFTFENQKFFPPDAFGQ